MNRRIGNKFNPNDAIETKYIKVYFCMVETTTKTKAWLHAFRLRTLPLAISGILCGSAVAYQQEHFKISVFILALITAVFLQILSNLANDYGDFAKGTDNEDRIGTPRALQSGMISIKAMKLAIVGFVVLCLISGVSLLMLAFGTEKLPELITFFILGIGGIAAAIKYTVGKSAYGYKGLGDVFVFFFFGVVAVYGVYILYAGEFFWPCLLPAISIGCFSTAVLNINNIRDIESDRKAGKITIPVRLGEDNARKYHIILMLIGGVSVMIYGFVSFTEYYQYIFLLAFIPLMKNAVFIAKWPVDESFNRFLKEMAISTLVFAICFSAGCLLS
jgi:1,4-dihydroxy-2-naphthoate octaprenyltransferase